MATLGHVAVGLCLGRMEAPSRPLWPMLAYSALALLPDLDVVAFALGIPYEDPFGHRGASHSFVFAGALAAVVALFHAPHVRTFALAFIAIASHGVLDAMTSGGLGVAFFWPTNTERFFLPFRPIPVAPIGMRMLSSWGASVLFFELICFLPLWAWALWPRRRRG